MKGNSHVRFGERGGETRLPQGRKVRSAPTLRTAGFLISSYKHILRANTDAKGNSILTPDEKGRLAANFRGYDISPDMVRLSLVNMYLHGFTDPHIYEYDTLTSQDRWNDYADVILANPPFMSPKGGIKPHNRFSVQSKRSEVLFVDYMAEHLTPGGRAGIIVPEGIIFQSQTAYRDLRKMLVDTALVAVVSLPAGVFQPYSGVKTSILILDKSLAKKADAIAFFKVENDGFGLGAQRREIEKNDLPETARLLREWMNHGIHGIHGKKTEKDFSGSPSVFSVCSVVGKCLIVPKERIAANGDYNLSGERYRDGALRNHVFPTVSLEEICEIIMGQSPPGETYNTKGDGVPLINGPVEFGPEPLSKTIINQYTTSPTKMCKEGDLILCVRGSTTGRMNIAGYAGCIGRGVAAIRSASSQQWVNIIINSLRDRIYDLGVGSTFPNITAKDLAALQIPLPPLEVQKEIVAEIEGYQKVIDGARVVLDNYRPHIPIHPDWPVKDLVEVATKITDGTHVTPRYTDSGIPFLRVTDITESNTSKKYLSEEEHRDLIKHCNPQKGDVLDSKNGTIGVAKLVDWDWEFSIFVSLALIKPNRELIDATYLTCFLNSDSAYAQATARSKSGTVTNLHLVDIKTIRVPLPPLTTQQTIVAEIEAEQALVAANRELIARFEKKIQATLARVWGEDAPAEA